MINIVIPMAGAGSRFSRAGYEKPKPFIDVAGLPMILRVMNNLQCANARFILVARSSHLATEAHIIKQITDNYNVSILAVDELTEGTACTVLAAKELIDNDVPLLIANSDQLVECSMDQFIQDCRARALDGSILVFEDKTRNPKWSFAEVDAQGHVVRVKEKEAISSCATVGIYLFEQGQDFVAAANQMVSKDDRVNGEFYVCPVYNHMIARGKCVGVYEIPEHDMFGLGTPEDLQQYLVKGA